MAVDRFFRQGLLALAALLFSVAAFAATVEVEGAALIDGDGLEQARRLAVQDALYKAEESAGVAVTSGTIRGGDGKLREDSRIRPAGSVVNPVILKEWREGGTLYVRIRAEVVVRDDARPNPSFRKKIAVTQFHVAHPLQVQDIDNIWNGYPLALLQRIEASGQFLPVQTSGWPALGRLALPLDRNQNRETVRLLADQSGAQFVLSGIVHDAGADGPTSAAMKFLTRDAGSRRIEVEIFLHDGVTGALIAHFRAQESIAGNDAVGRDKPFGSAAFFTSPFGQAVSRLLDRQAHFIAAEVGRLPFVAKIIRIEGNHLYFDAGSTSGLAAGDKFLLYTLAPSGEAFELSSNRLLGVAEKPAASLSVKQVQPLFSVGESEARNQKIQIGDMIRFESSAMTRVK